MAQQVFYIVNAKFSSTCMKKWVDTFYKHGLKRVDLNHEFIVIYGILCDNCCDILCIILNIC